MIAEVSLGLGLDSAVEAPGIITFTLHLMFSGRLNYRLKKLDNSLLHLVELSEARSISVVDGSELIRDLIAEYETLVSGVRVCHSLEGLSH